jgi:hypothetical protein
MPLSKLSREAIAQLTPRGGAPGGRVRGLRVEGRSVVYADKGTGAVVLGMPYASGHEAVLQAEFYRQAYGDSKRLRGAAGAQAFG